jgi:hypothetical protein
MEIEIAVLADAANVSQEGKLNILGVFERIGAHQTPVSHSQLSMVVYARANPSERGQRHTLDINLIDEDGAIVNAFPTLPITVPANVSGSSIPMPLIINFPGQVFPKFGEYRYDLLVDGKHQADIPLIVYSINPGQQE